jgi:hypothetical protein
MHMKISPNKLQSMKTTFHGIVPGMSAVQLGRVVLDVVFVSKGNYHKEKITFEVVDFDSPFHAIFGHPAYAKSMARPYCIYNKLKISGPNGFITIDRNLKKAAKCKLGGSTIAQLAINRKKLAEICKEVVMKDMTPTKRLAGEPAVQFESAQDTKRIALEKGDDSKMASIGVHLSDK